MMFKNNVKIAWRNLIKTGLYSVLNIVGDFCGCRVRCFLIALLTVSFQAIKAALLKPVNSLRSA